MATVQSLGGGGNITNLSNAQTGNGQSTNVVRRTDSPVSRASLIRIVTTIGVTPTCTYQIEGSPDGTNFYPLSTYDATGAASPTGATFALTTATTTWRVVPVDLPWTFLRITYSANTNVTSTADIWVY